MKKTLRRLFGAPIERPRGVALSAIVLWLYAALFLVDLVLALAAGDVTAQLGAASPFSLVMAVALGGLMPAAIALGLWRMRRWARFCALALAGLLAVMGVAALVAEPGLVNALIAVVGIAWLAYLWRLDRGLRGQ